MVMLWAVSCGSNDPQIVATMDGWSLTLSEMAGEYDRVYPAMPFAATSLEERERFLTNVVNKELLLGVARERSLPLGWSRDRKLRSEREAWLADRAFELLKNEVMTQIGREDRQETRDRLTREIQLLRIILPRGGRPDSCYRAIADGLPFEEAFQEFAVARRREGAPPPLPIGPAWFAPDSLPRRVVRRTLNDDVPAGSVVPPIVTLSGVWIVKVLDHRPANLSDAQKSRIEALVQIFCTDDSMRVRDARRREAAGFRTHPENYPVIHRAFDAFWDSLSAANPRANTIEMLGWKAPVWNVAPADRELPIYEFNGKIGTVSDFVSSLNGCDAKYWPGGTTDQKRSRQVGMRIDRLFLLDIAMERGLDRDPEFLAKEQRLEEEAALDEYFAQVIEPAVVVTPDEVRADYERDPERYRSSEKAAFSVVIFPGYAKEDAERFLAEHGAKAAGVWRQAVLRAIDADDQIVFIPDRETLDLGRPVRNAQLIPFLPLVAEMETGDISDLVPHGDGYAIVRCNYRRHSAPLPEKSVLHLVEGEVRHRKIDERVEEILAAAARARRLRTYSERLRGVPESSPETSR